MTILVTLSPALEEQLRAKAIRQDRDIDLVATELLAIAIESEAQDSAEAIEGIQQGLNDFAAGKCRSFSKFADEHRRKYNLPA
jgi:hypothetical protein